jgi:hypothetical protein
VGPRAGLDGCGKSILHRVSNPAPSSRYTGDGTGSRKKKRFCSWVLISSRRPAMLFEVFRSFSQTLQENVRTVPQIRQRPVPSVSLPFHWSLTIYHPTTPFPQHDSRRGNLITFFPLQLNSFRSADPQLLRKPQEF